MMASQIHPASLPSNHHRTGQRPIIMEQVRGVFFDSEPIYIKTIKLLWSPLKISLIREILFKWFYEWKIKIIRNIMCFFLLKIHVLIFDIFLNCRFRWRRLYPWHPLAYLCAQDHIIFLFAPQPIFQFVVAKQLGHFLPAMSHYQHATFSTSLPVAFHRYHYHITRFRLYLLIPTALLIIYLVSNMCLHPQHSFQPITISHIISNIILRFIRWVFY